MAQYKQKLPVIDAWQFNTPNPPSWVRDAITIGLIIIIDKQLFLVTQNKIVVGKQAVLIEEGTWVINRNGSLDLMTDVVFQQSFEAM